MISIAGTVSKGWLAKSLGVKFGYDYYLEEKVATDFAMENLRR